MNTEPLMDAIVDAVLFLELSDRTRVDPDAAVAMLEQIASTLRELDPQTQQDFRMHLKIREARTSSAAERRALKTLASDLGMNSE